MAGSKHCSEGLRLFGIAFHPGGPSTRSVQQHPYILLCLLQMLRNL